MSRSELERAVNERIAGEYRMLRDVLPIEAVRDDEDVAINTALVRAGIRPAFLLQSGGYYTSPDEWENDAPHSVVTESVAAIEQVTAPGSLTLVPYGEDFLVANTSMWDHFAPLVDQYMHNRPRTLREFQALGEVLGYPCAGDSHKLSRKKYLVRLVTEDGREVMSNVCASNENRKWSESIFHDVADYARTRLGEHLMVYTREVH